MFLGPDPIWQGFSTLRVLKLNYSLAMEPHSTQDATKHLRQILDAKYKKADLQLSKFADLAKSIRDTARSMDIYHQSWS
jgi:hypothetical protein